MLAPLLLAGVLAIVGWQLGRSGRSPVKDVVSGNKRRRLAPKPRYLPLLSQIIATNQTPTMGLLEAAYTEAAQMGDKHSMLLIERFCMEMLIPTEPINSEANDPDNDTEVAVGANLDSNGEEKAWPSDPNDTQGDGETAESWGEMVNAPQTLTPQGPKQEFVGPPEIPQDVTPEQWIAFTNALRTRDVGYQNDNYLGQFEHNRRRLRQLGLPEAQLQNADAQYKALCTDINNYRQSCEKLIKDFSGIEVELTPGQKLQVTPSGVLGLLKAAGPRGAEGWLTNPDDRQAFPTTTEVFLRCNGCF